MRAQPSPRNAPSAAQLRLVPATRTFALSDLTAERQLLVRCEHGHYWEYEGTREQLEAEFDIPTDLVWPKGALSVSFGSGRLNCSLHRKRPPSLKKGPLSAWIYGDWWCLRVQDSHALDFHTQAVLRKERELEQARYEYSQAGRDEQSAKWDRLWAARKDKAFRAVMTLLEPVRPPRKNAAAPQEVQA